MANTNFHLQSSNARSIKGFGENISQLSLYVNVSHLDISFFHMISRKVVSHFEVFHSFVEDWVFGYRDSTGVVTHDENSLKDHSKVSRCAQSIEFGSSSQQHLHTQPLWWIEQLKIIFEKTSKQERIQENYRYQK
jgi:hypothetical protein